MLSRGINIVHLEEALKHVAPSGRFAAGAKIVNLDLGYIEIRWLGQILLPLRFEDVALLRDHCEQAPYGRGTETVVDTSVRRAWQIDGHRIMLPGAEGKIQQLANAAARALGINTDCVGIKPSLYKLVFYDEGGHFVKHRDTEKEPGMFGTMVLQCPVAGGHTGGEFSVWHKGQQECFTFSEESSQSFFSMAFFADCEHELKPLRSGYRLCLIFNLVRDHSVFSLPPPDHFQLPAALPLVEAALRPWSNASSVSRDCPKIAILLEHQYTEQNLSFWNLKGRDRVMADVLRCVRDSGNNPMLELHLAILTKHESGTAEDSPPGRQGFRNIGETRTQHRIMEEVYETSIKLKNWIAVDDSPFGVEGLDIEVNGELVPSGDPFVNSNPDKEEYEGYTGNEGPTLDYWYHAAVLIIWPRCKSVEILKRTFNMSALIDLLERKDRERSPELSSMLTQAINYLGGNPARNAPALHSFDVDPNHLYSRLMLLAVHLNSEAGATKLLDILAPTHTVGLGIRRGIMDSSCAEVIASAIRTFTWERLEDRVLRLITPLNLATQLGHIVHLYNAVDVFNKMAAVEIAQKVFREISSANPEICLNGKWGLLFSMLLKIDGSVEFGARYLRSVLPRLKSSSLNAMLSEAARLCQQGRNVLSETVKVDLIKEISRHLVAKHFTQEDEAIIADIARNLYWLNDEISVQAFRPQILSSPNTDQLLSNLLKDVNSLFNVNPASSWAKNSLRNSILCRITRLEACRPPTFSWRMPKANFPRHPQVEAFLRGPESEFVYRGLNGIAHARNFANKYFNGSYQDGYSGEGIPGGHGPRAYCEIKKTRAAFKALEDEYRNGLEELKLLRHTLAEIPWDSQVPFTPSTSGANSTPRIVNQGAPTSSVNDIIILN